LEPTVTLQCQRLMRAKLVSVYGATLQDSRPNDRALKARRYPDAARFQRLSSFSTNFLGAAPGLI
jgi:hypothetical protein